MTLTKLLRNEENDTIGTQKTASSGGSSETVAVNGKINKGNAEKSKGRATLFVILIAVFGAGAGAAAYAAVKKKKQEEENSVHTLSLKDSLRY